MAKALPFVIAVTFALPSGILRAEPPARTEPRLRSSDAGKTSDRDPARARLLESANGWTFVKGEWVHPDGYKFVNNKILRTTAKTGKPFPRPPGNLALENALKLTPRTRSAPSAPDNAKAAAEKAVEERRKNLTPSPASQTGTHL